MPSVTWVPVFQYIHKSLHCRKADVKRELNNLYKQLTINKSTVLNITLLTLILTDSVTWEDVVTSLDDVPRQWNQTNGKGLIVFSASQCNLQFNFVLLLIFKLLSCHLETYSTATVGAHHLTFLTEFIATTWVIAIPVTHSCHSIYITLILSHTKPSEWQPAEALWFSGFCIITFLFLALLSAHMSSLYKKKSN